MTGLYRIAFRLYALGVPLAPGLRAVLDERRKPDGSYPVPPHLDPTVTP